MTRKRNAVETYMPLVIEKYHGDTAHLSTLLHGAYLLLLMQYWRSGAALPDDDDQLRAIAKMDRAEWKKARPILAAFFDVRGGRWVQKRAEEELERARIKSAKAKASASVRWESDANAHANASREHDERIPKADEKTCSGHAPPSSIEEPNGSFLPLTPAPKPAKRKTKIPIPEDWAPHDRHREKAAALGVDCDLEAERMRNWAAAGGARCEQWDARFFNWMLKAKEIASVGKQGQHGRGDGRTAGQVQRDIQLAAAIEAARRAGGGHGLWDGDQRE